jgi:hypothetical protein
MSFIRQYCLILGSEYFVGEIIECVLSLCGSLFGTQDEAHRRVLVRFRPMLAGVVQVEVHLPRVSEAEFGRLEVNDDQATQPAMKEDEIDAKPVVIDAQTTLATKEGKVIAQAPRENL